MDPLQFTEADLMNLYEDLLALPTPSEPSTSPEPVLPAQAEEDILVINQIDQRLASSQAVQSDTQPYQRVLSNAQDVISRVEAVRASLSAHQPTDIPITILSTSESESLVRVCVCWSFCLCRIF